MVRRFVSSFFRSKPKTPPAKVLTLTVSIPLAEFVTVEEVIAEAYRQFRVQLRKAIVW